MMTLLAVFAGGVIGAAICYTREARRKKKPVETYKRPTPTSGEVRLTDPVTGAQKGRKPERYSLLPQEALAEVAKVYAYGAEKYDDHNWRAGYPWSWSEDAKQRHGAAFWSGKDLDDESGYYHLAHQAFHVLTQLQFLIKGDGTDDRYKP